MGLKLLVYSDPVSGMLCAEAGDMTGGKRGAEVYERSTFPPPEQRARTPDEVASLLALEKFKNAMRFRRTLHRLLKDLGVSFADWRVLEGLSRLVRQSGEPVSDLEVARELDLGQSSVSRLMTQLFQRGLVDSNIDAWNFSYRVLPTRKSEEIVAAAYALAALRAAQSGRSSL